MQAVSFCQIFKLAIYKIETHKRCVKIIIKNVGISLFYCTFLGSLCVLWAFWVIRMGLVCQYDAREGRCDGGISLTEWMVFFFCYDGVSMVKWSTSRTPCIGLAKSILGSATWSDPARITWLLSWYFLAQYQVHQSAPFSTAELMFCSGFQYCAVS